MARDPHRTPPPAQLTETGRQRAIAEAADKIAELSRTPSPGGHHMRPSESSEQIRAIARDEAQRTSRDLINEYQNECVNSGPICGVWKAIDGLRTKVSTMETEQAENRGAQKAQARNVTIIVAVVGVLGLATQVIGLLVRLRHP